jgi:hypothetical protein
MHIKFLAWLNCEFVTSPFHLTYCSNWLCPWQALTDKKKREKKVVLYTFTFMNLFPHLPVQFFMLLRDVHLLGLKTLNSTDQIFIISFSFSLPINASVCIMDKLTVGSILHSSASSVTGSNTYDVFFLCAFYINIF